MEEKEQQRVYLPAVGTIVLGCLIVVNAFFWGYLAIFILPFAAAILLVGLVGTFTRPKGLIRWVNIASLLSIAVSVVNLVFFIGQDREVTHAMTWKVTEERIAEGTGYSLVGERCVQLTYVEWPSRYETLCSTALADELNRRDEGKPLQVTFEMTFDWYALRGYSLETIEGRTLCHARPCGPDQLLGEWTSGGEVVVDGASSAGTPFDWAHSSPVRD